MPLRTHPIASLLYPELVDESNYRANVIRLAFKGDESTFREFTRIVQESVPEAHCAVIRGSAVTGERYDDGAPFDADGPGTSDIDLTLVGADVLRYFKATGYWIPGIHTRPLSEKDPDIAPDLVPLRRRLMDMVHRPVNIQGTRDWVQSLRTELMDQPYVTLYGSVSES